MERIRFALAGAGWRAQFFLRAAKLLPERFELTGVLCRTQERAEAFAREHGVRAVWTLDALLEDGPEFVVSCVSKAGMCEMVKALLQVGMPVLSETPLATEMDALRALYDIWRKTRTPLGLAEQYFLFPRHQARRALIERGLLGNVVSCALSTAHDYHAISLLRHYLGEEGGPVRIRARRTVTPIAVTGSRSGYLAGGGMGEETRVYAQLDYPDGRLGLYDFSGTQYHSAIRGRHVRILGTRGEIFDDEVSYVAADGRPVQGRLQVQTDLISGTIRAIDFEGERVYENPFRADVPMDEDEIAVASALAGMGRLVHEGEAFYPIRFAFRDAAMACLLAQAAQEDGERITPRMPWDE